MCTLSICMYIALSRDRQKDRQTERQIRTYGRPQVPGKAAETDHGHMTDTHRTPPTTYHPSCTMDGSNCINVRCVRMYMETFSKRASSRDRAPCRRGTQTDVNAGRHTQEGNPNTHPPPRHGINAVYKGAGKND
mmetsp:Transcript_9714/g.28021  ORF Transcript_9714/g.28021 Transcript_9714/m.28021 type:complete len:134 (+) Transcript_9714:191-592(+)